MKSSAIIRQHWAALRTLLLLTVITGLVYPLLVWAVAQIPGLQSKADGSIVEVNGKALGSSLIGQLFTDADGNPLPQYFQSRPSVAGDGYDPMATSASNLGPEDIVDTADRTSLLTQVCTRSLEVGAANGVDGARPFCTGDGVGAVLSVLSPTDVVSVNQACPAAPFVTSYNGAPVRCNDGSDLSTGRLVAVEGSARAVVPADAVTASGSGLDPDISPAYAQLQVERVARARGISAAQVRQIVDEHTEGRALGFMGEPAVNVLEVNLALDQLGG
ncbi:potassium-transporting ATPase KdpC subunit [Mycolicibacterium murale]|jgi:K+-transporting ATPase ATPase C chain|uniref:Potassium-transporting ATPase KdpC subunit n=1 Tax=Mycolicibacterium murale TaxID=182220 RepID=A0A7I9WIN7_9MYCO|nr:potassium-transporting ATPase subunit C [Mycolicibacterium murale]MCV7184006.1 potassium-transporting ATPase subunit C [Mycolicibacterium murale]GFG57523.1 potassium-transporting ATPase KdpC subunit [Mycolicibacterium murale]